MGEFHPELRRIARFLPRRAVGPRMLPIIRRLEGMPRPKAVSGVAVTEVTGAIGLRVYRPAGLKTPGPALLWIHGGGMIIGTAKQDEWIASWLARELGILVASVDYRLAPDFPFPTPLEDCYAGLQWLHDQPDVVASRIAIGGASAGGGLAASLAQLAHDRGALPVAFQLLVYPMLDDRSAVRPGVDGSQHRLWNQKANKFGWRCYLGQDAGTEGITAPAAPARRDDLAGLPPAWVGVGALDLFHDEDVEYAKRLEAAGVPCVLNIVPGAFHGFDIIAKDKPVAKAFHAQWIDALREALALT